MIKFAIAGTKDFFNGGKRALEQEGYIPELEIHGEERVIAYKEVIQGKKLELLVCLAHPNILTSDEINLFPKGCINLHTGIPKYCGRHPVNWMIIDELKEIPVAVHYMTRTIDGGDIIVEDSFLRERTDDYNSIMKKITEMSSRLLVSSIKQIESDSVYRKKQVLPREYPRRRIPEDSKVDWNKTSRELHNFISALVDPLPNAFAYTTDGERVIFNRSYVGEEMGKVIATTSDGRYVISTKDGVILIESDKKLKVGDRFR